MTKFQKKKQSGLFMAALFFIILILQVTFLVWLKGYLLARKIEAATTYGQLISTNLQLSFQKYEYLTSTLTEALILDEETFQEDYERYGDQLISEHPEVQSVYLGKNGILVKGYPYEKTKNNIGSNIFRDFASAKGKEENQGILMEPVGLLSGNRGILLIYPVDRTKAEALQDNWCEVLVLDEEKFSNTLSLSLVNLEEYNVGFYVGKWYEGKDERSCLLSYGEIENDRVDIPFCMNTQFFHVIVDRKDHWELTEEMFPYVVFTFAFGIFIWCLFYLLLRIAGNRRQLEFIRQADEEKAAFLAKMSHDMRTPLNGLLGLLSISDDHPEDVVLLQKNRNQEKSIIRYLLSMINGLLGQKEAEADQGKAEADQGKAEADQEKAEADQEKAEADQGKAEADQKKTEALDDLRGVRVLLVDDTSMNLEVETIMLEERNATVTQAICGKEALNQYESHEAGSFDVILLDISMPNMNGYEVAKKIRKMDKADAKTIPIIAVTANAFSEDIRKCKLAGMNDHIAKPFERAKMIRTIRKYVM